jgi:hypothetical protein
MVKCFENGIPARQVSPTNRLAKELGRAGSLQFAALLKMFKQSKGQKKFR